MLYSILCLKDRQGLVQCSIYLHSCSCVTGTLWSQIWESPTAPSLTNTKKPDCRNSPPSTLTVHKSTTDWHFEIPFDVIFTSAKSNPLNSIFRISSTTAMPRSNLLFITKPLRFGPPIRQFSWLVVNKLPSMVWMDFNVWLSGGVSPERKPHRLSFAALHW